jgi:hypothetical protein
MPCAMQRRLDFFCLVVDIYKRWITFLSLVFSVSAEPFAAKRTTASCALRIRCDLWNAIYHAYIVMLLYVLQRYARADKRAMLPQWIQQYMSDTKNDLSVEEVC